MLRLSTERKGGYAECGDRLDKQTNKRLAITRTGHTCLATGPNTRLAIISVRPFAMTSPERPTRESVSTRRAKEAEFGASLLEPFPDDPRSGLFAGDYITWPTRESRKLK